jgi:hypothetical protein
MMVSPVVNVAVGDASIRLTSLERFRLLFTTGVLAVSCVNQISRIAGSGEDYDTECRAAPALVLRLEASFLERHFPGLCK